MSADDCRVEPPRQLAELREGGCDLAPRLLEPRLLIRSRVKLAPRAGSDRAKARPAAAGHRRAGCAPCAAAPSGHLHDTRARPAQLLEPCSSSACSRAFSSAMPAAAVTASSSSGSSLSEGSCSSAATCAPSRSISVIARRLSGVGNSTGWPARSTTPELGQPVRERQRRIAECACNRAAQIGRRQVRPQPHEQVADGRAGEARIEEPDQERDRRDPDRRSRSLAGLLRTAGPWNAACTNRTGNHHEADSEQSTGARPHARRGRSGVADEPRERRSQQHIALIEID